MQRVFRVVDTRELSPKGVKTTGRFNRSIGRFGVLNPVLLAEVPDEDGVIQLHILDGNRRVRAARASRLSKVPAVVLKETTLLDRARLTLICNFMRSSNFHTESLAITMLGGSEEAIGQAAGEIGLGPMKMQQLYRKITSMPEAVRQAMYEHRIPVTGATWVGGWPDDLQAEVVETLARRRHLNTPALKAMKASYDARFPGSAAPVEDGAGNQRVDGWLEDDAVGLEVEIPLPAPTFVDPSRAAVSSVEPEPGTTAPATVVAGSLTSDPGTIVRPFPAPMSRPAGSETAAATPPTVVPVGAVEPVPVPPEELPAEARRPSDEPPQQPVVREHAAGMIPARAAGDAFLARLDAELLRLAQETIVQELPRAVWIDRAMRAWNRAENTGDFHLSATR